MDTFCSDTEENRKRYTKLGYDYIDMLNKTNGRSDTQNFLVATTVAGREVSYTTYVFDASFKNYDDLLEGINFDNIILAKHQVDELQKLSDSFIGVTDNRIDLDKIEVAMNEKLESYGIEGYHYVVTTKENQCYIDIYRDIDNHKVKIFTNNTTVQEIELAKASVYETEECDIDVTTYDLKTISPSNRLQIGYDIIEDLTASFRNNDIRSIRLDLDENGILRVNNLIDSL